jgi:hypothetical protein
MALEGATLNAHSTKRRRSEVVFIVKIENIDKNYMAIFSKKIISSKAFTLLRETGI